MSAFDFNGDGHTSYAEVSYALDMMEDAERNGDEPENVDEPGGALGCFAWIVLAVILIGVVAIGSAVGAI